MSENQTNDATVTVPPPDEAILDTVREVQRLRLERGKLERQINRLLGSLPPDTAVPTNSRPRPTWGPCTRCGHIWRGHWVNLPPRGCPRCGSSGWRVEPVRPDARRPDDPPNPRWGKNRTTGLPADPGNVLGRKTRAAASARRKLRRNRLAAAAADSARERRLALEAASPEERSARLTPPPRLEDVAATVEVRPMVAPPNIRFAESESTAAPSSTAAPPTPPSSGGNFEEPSDGVPIRINEDGTITELDSTDDELVEAINDSANDNDNVEEEDPSDGHES